MPDTAVIYIPSLDFEEAALACMEYGKVSGYRIIGIVVGRWEDAQAMAYGGLVQVIIVAEWWHLPADRLPRIEIVSEMTNLHVPAEWAGPSPARRRPRLLGS